MFEDVEGSVRTFSPVGALTRYVFEASTGVTETPGVVGVVGGEAFVETLT